MFSFIEVGKSRNCRKIRIKVLSYKVSKMSEQQRNGSAKHTKATLSIEQKLKVLDYAKENPKESCKTLSTKFSVGKTQIAAILKNETELCYISLTAFLNVLLTGNLVKSQSKQLKHGWKDCLKSIEATS